MIPDELCTSDTWSPLAAAAGHSQLAGVLGGFLITAIALLFDRNSREGVHILALFSSAVLILMLDSFLFSLISGNQTPDAGERGAVCAISWTQTALATGMLAAGTTALFGGLGWMLAGHAVNRAGAADTDDIAAYSFLADLGGWLTFAAAMSSTLILSETTVDDLRAVYDRSPSDAVVAAITTTAALAVLVEFLLVYVRTRELRRSLASAAEQTRLALRSIKVATIGLVGLAVVAGWFALSVPRFPRGWLTEPNLAVVAVVVALAFAAPIFVATAICYSVASTDVRRIRLRGRQSRATSA
ncbi:hypothetical protein [Mycolicibacterium gilvum]|uniref:Uncharacterized protein n=1 Tax=Mycolicibacterium gilvum (strain DSM 45189 / LMG 24558 / Spyr1) TaxID=278137 RepID=E6TCE6_MYCSR|nr:hypothetical protein [Mycolicibacterium gilvum]ADT99713.1 hypothetical protein Mspyr1_30960 [Mycolicibacterium gilvum Spyr1]